MFDSILSVCLFKDVYIYTVYIYIYMTHLPVRNGGIQGL